MKKCPYCGRENPDEAKSCTKCFAGFPKEEKPNPAEGGREKKRKGVNEHGT